MMLGLVGVEDGVSGVRIVGLLREIPTGTVCPPISLERTFPISYSLVTMTSLLAAKRLLETCWASRELSTCGAWALHVRGIRG